MYYYSISPKDMECLDMGELIDMNSAADIFIAQDMLNDFKISSFPHLQKKDKEKLHKEVHKLANPNVWEKPRALSLKDIASIIGGNRV